MYMYMYMYMCMYVHVHVYVYMYMYIWVLFSAPEKHFGGFHEFNLLESAPGKSGTSTRSEAKIPGKSGTSTRSEAKILGILGQALGKIMFSWFPRRRRRRGKKSGFGPPAVRENHGFWAVSGGFFGQTFFLGAQKRPHMYMILFQFSFLSSLLS